MGGREGSPGVNEPTGQQVNEARFRKFEVSRTRNIEDSKI